MSIGNSLSALDTKEKCSEFRVDRPLAYHKAVPWNILEHDGHILYPLRWLLST